MHYRHPPAVAILKPYDVTTSRRGFILWSRSGGEPPLVDAILRFTDSIVKPTKVSPRLQYKRTLLIRNLREKADNGAARVQPDHMSGTGENAATQPARYAQHCLSENPSHDLADCVSEIAAGKRRSSRYAKKRRARRKHLLLNLSLRSRFLD